MQPPVYVGSTKEVFDPEYKPKEPMGAKYPHCFITSRGAIEAMQSAERPLARLWRRYAGLVIPEDPRDRDRRIEREEGAVQFTADYSSPYEVVEQGPDYTIVRERHDFEDPPTLRDTGEIDPLSLR